MRAEVADHLRGIHPRLRRRGVSVRDRAFPERGERYEPTEMQLAAQTYRSGSYHAGEEDIWRMAMFPDLYNPNQ